MSAATGYESTRAAAAAAAQERNADLRRLAAELYRADTAGVVGARLWDDLPLSVQVHWLMVAEGSESGRRLYERSWGDLPGVTPWDELRDESRAVWIAEAIANPGRRL